MRRKIIPYNPNLKQLARYRRTHSTLAEVLLWRELKGEQLRGCDFHRQKPIGDYIVDFYCPDLSLAIEIDGSSHDEKIEKDEERQQKLESFGVTFIRFTDREVKTNLSEVVMTIENWIDTHRPTPNPSGGGE